jgi:CheY-like chemotaxis protein
VSAPARILVVDDTPRNVKLLGDLRTVRGYAVITATSGAEALGTIEAERPDLVLLDVVMPERAEITEPSGRSRTSPSACAARRGPP